MRNIIIILRSFFRKGNSNLIKVLSLGFGLAMGLILIAKVYIEQSYDHFFPDGERVYIIQTNYSQQGEEVVTYSMISGGVAPGMKERIPEVESATRYTWMADDATFCDENRNRYKGDFIIGDTSLFDVFPRPILAGNWKEVLSLPLNAMVSRTIAERMGGVTECIDKMIEVDNFSGVKIRIGGVFEDIPENSHLEFNIVVSMNSIMDQLYGYDGSLNWMGNDRYIGYFKLREGVDPASLLENMRRVQEVNQDMEELQKSGIELAYSLLPLKEIHSGTPEVKRMSRLLSMLAFVILFTAIANYILIVISSLVNRSKEIAILKCYGANNKNIYGRMLGETFIYLILSISLAVMLILTFRETISKLLDISLGSLFSWESSLLLIGVCLIVFLVSGLIPGYLYSRIPVASAFRNYSETRRFWKLGLLFFQFLVAGFLITLLVTINRQYNYMVNLNPGYQYENLAYAPLMGVDSTSRRMIVEEVGRLSEVAAVSSCSVLPLHSASGNNVRLPDDERDLFNIADLYSVGDGYLDLMEIPVIEGRSFQEGKTALNEVMVSRSFVEKMSQFIDWSDGPIGKNVLLSEHSQHETDFFTICGVYEDFRIGAIGNEDPRPSVMFYRQKPSWILLIKYHQLSSESNRKVSEKIEELLPDKEISVNPYPAEIQSLYRSSLMFRDAIIIGSLVALIISLSGLIGYTDDEMNRRKKEVAIRKVNGATLFDIERLFLSGIIRIAFPALIIAGCIAAYTALQWQSRFTEKATLSPLIFLICGLFVLLLISLVVSVNCYKSANENPARSVKAE